MINRIKFVIRHLIYNNSKNRIIYIKNKKPNNNKNIIIRKYHSKAHYPKNIPPPSNPNNILYNIIIASILCSSFMKIKEINKE